MAETFSIRRRLLVGAIAALGLALLALMAISAFYARQAADRAFDRLLAGAALSISGAVQVEDNDVALELPPAALLMLAYSGEDRVFYLVQGPAGAAVTGYPDFGNLLPRAASTDPVFATIEYRGEPTRVATVGRLVTLGERTGWVTVRVGQTQDARAALARELTARASLGLAALAALALVLLSFGLGRALRPLRAIELELRRREPNDLAPLREPVPVEVSALALALNDFMGRLDNLVRRLRSLLADAAHQVRTPLAALRAQAEIALEETDPERLRDRLGRIHANAVHASQLVSQILMDATVLHRLESQEWQPVAVSQVLEDVLKSLDPGSADRVDAAVGPDAANASVNGDRIALREMLRNLVENALLHAPGSPVEISVTAEDGGRVALAVLDRGPGIPDADKPAVLERFRRGAAAKEGTGSGLGLSIADTVARGHGGALVLTDRPGGGLCARVTLPAAFAPGRAGLGMTAAMAALLLLAAAVAPDAARADAVLSRYPASGPELATLVIAGATDKAQFEPVIRDFQATRPDLAVAYVEMDTVELHERFLAGTLDLPPDVLISSAIDLQIKLANDGHALAYASAATAALPGWARWRNEVFGFTFEPAVMVYNPDLIPDAEAPRSRAQLVRLLGERGESLRGRIATYDIVRSGVGHLLAAQDAQISSSFWRLTSAMGNAGVLLERGSGAMIDRVERGDLALAYNVLGSYAFARQAAGARLRVVMPSDYTLALSRAVLIPRGSAHPEAARALIDYLLSPRGQALLARIGLGAVMGEGSGTASAIAAEARGPVQPVPLGPALLTFLDQQRRSRFLQAWLQLVSGI
ncbi:extracellular solute-binding protein [Alsobacter sp. SYSU M60028]|uniref:histidine kinase n=1 Tax=Alsobacter ponti TaxID=2962936 RepID=A0ABT1L7X7_9HYPH|nr:extracellular solute-binding protein [Alsobacter ponti]MCP8937606.1 extracellular solute-binding protein [Alsobacter ponti]